MKSIDEIMANPNIRVLQSGFDGGMAKVKHFAPKGKEISIVFSWGAGWDHVSASYSNRCLTWEEMCHIKNCFFAEDECVVQYHPREDEYVNLHTYCLHLWKPQNDTMPTPPKWMVG